MFRVEVLGIDYNKLAFVKVPMNVNIIKIDNSYKDIRIVLRIVAKELITINILPVDIVSVYNLRTNTMMWEEERGEYYSK